MKISTKGRYALRIAVDLAAHQTGEPISLKDISVRQDISKKYLEQIVPELSRAKLLRTVRGNKGGYLLTKAPEDITVGDILRAAEGSLAPISCLDDQVNICPRSEYCSTLYVWQGLYDAINKYVDSISLQDIVDRQSDFSDFSI